MNISIFHSENVPCVPFFTLHPNRVQRELHRKEFKINGGSPIENFNIGYSNKIDPAQLFIVNKYKF